MEAIPMLVMMMGNPFEVKKFVLRLFFVSHNRTKACEGQRLPAHAKNKKHLKNIPHHF